MNAPFHESAGTRTTTSAVTFAHPFRLGSDVSELPAGTYTLHTDEQLFTSGDRSWSARADIVMEVRQVGGKADRHVAPADLNRAVAADSERSALLQAASENPDRGLASR